MPDDRLPLAHTHGGLAAEDYICAMEILVRVSGIPNITAQLMESLGASQ